MWNARHQIHAMYLKKIFHFETRYTYHVYSKAEIIHLF